MKKLGLLVTVLVTLKVPVALKVPLALVVQLVRGNPTLVEVRTWKVPLSGPFVPLQIKLEPENAKLLTTGLDTVIETTVTVPVPVKTPPGFEAVAP